VAGVAKYHEELIKQNKVAIETLQILKKIEKFQSVLAFKGCGALGADAVLILFESKAEVVQHLESAGFEVIATHKDLSEGILIQDLESEKILFERTL
jgi:hypothetical protein